MLAMEDTGALLRFVQRTNDVDLGEGELVLRSQGRYSELVALYQQRGQHEAALNLLHTLTLSPQDLPTPPSGQSHLLLHVIIGPEIAAVCLLCAPGPDSSLDLSACSDWHMSQVARHLHVHA